MEFIELKQRHIEAFSKDIPKAGDTPIPVYNGAVLRAAIKAGWFVEKMKPEEVDDMPPAKVGELALAVIREYAKVMEISPE
jgi:hypothetical protein